VTWEGALRFADGEVADGWWDRPGALYARLTDPTWPLVPDSRQLLDVPQVRRLLLG
jgi:hypothetical protein